MDAIDNRYKYSEVCAYYEILKSNLRDHMNKRTKSMKMDLRSIFAKEKEGAL